MTNATFTFETVIARETEKSYGVKSGKSRDIIWLPKSQCEATRETIPNEEDIIRAEVTYKVIECGMDIAEEADLIEEAVAHKMSKRPYRFTVPTWLANKKRLAYHFGDREFRIGV